MILPRSGNSWCELLINTFSPKVSPYQITTFLYHWRMWRKMLMVITMVKVKESSTLPSSGWNAVTKTPLFTSNLWFACFETQQYCCVRFEICFCKYAIIKICKYANMQILRMQRGLPCDLMWPYIAPCVLEERQERGPSHQNHNCHEKSPSSLSANHNYH